MKARIAKAETGALQFLGWQDTELDVACRFQPLRSGAFACLPSGEDVGWVSDEDPQLYGDAACSRPVVELSRASRCSVPRFAQVGSPLGESGGCEAERRYVRVGKAAQALYEKNGNDCAPVTTPEPSSALAETFVEVEPFDVQSFAGGTLRQGSVSQGIQPVYVTSDDGAEAFWSFRDAAEGFDCELGPMGEGFRCIPADMPVLTGGNFADSACRQPAALALGFCANADSAAYVLDVSPHAPADAELRVLERGTRLATSYTGSSAPGDCGPLQTADVVFAVGEVVPSSRFVAAELVENPDELGLIMPIQLAGGWSVAGSLPVQSSDFMGYECALLPTSDGVVRCVPRPTLYDAEFADAECTQLLIQGWETTAAVSLAEQCSPQVRVFERGEEYTGPLYRKEGVECMPDGEQPAQPSRTIYHRLQDELSPDSFPAMPITLR